MTTGTSPLRGAFFRRRPDEAGREGRDWRWIGRGAASLYLVGLAATVSMAWHDPSVATGTTGGFAGLQLAFLMTTGAAAALFALRGEKDDASAKAVEEVVSEPGTSELLTQMSHELRTPLNAMIGFSEVMLRELHGPLGHERYQEYASHINESGGRLLKASEDTLAVTATMSALMAKRGTARRQRILASVLVQKAWATATGEEPGADDRLVLSNCNACEIECERRATEQALEHLLREAACRSQSGGRVEVKGRRRAGARSIEIRVAAMADGGARPGPSAGAYISGGNLRVILARLLLEMQGATLSLWEDENGWAACVAFPPRG
jgi:signal transduction histidine kinase